MQASFLIIESQTGQRLDKFLAEQCQSSRAQAQKWIKSGQVRVNGAAMAVPHYAIKKDDRVEVTTGMLMPERSEAESKAGRLAPFDYARGVIVIAEEPDYVVIEKPAGLLVHPNWIPGQARDDNKHTLADWIIAHYPECAAVGDKPDIRPGIVHRLDKEASGLMVIARTQEFFDALKRQFKTREVQKEYQALTHDVLPEEMGDIDFPIAQSTQEARMSARPLSQGGKEARTEYEVMERYTNATLVRVIPKTGRTHQIRVHFFALGYPLIGDPLYFNKKDKRKLDAALGRLFLHATRIQFANQTGETVEYESTLPNELAAFLQTLKVLRPIRPSTSLRNEYSSQ